MVFTDTIKLTNVISVATETGGYNMGSGGAGYYGGGGTIGYSLQFESGNRSGGGGSSFHGHLR